MQKMKFLILSFSVIAGVGGAFASQPKCQCEDAQQYRKVNQAYVEIHSEFGVGYDCMPAATNCTYWRPDPFTRPYDFAPCRTGTYYVVPPITNQKSE